MKKGMSLSTETIVILLIALIVIVILLMIFQDHANQFINSIKNFFGMVNSTSGIK